MVRTRAVLFALATGACVGGHDRPSVLDTLLVSTDSVAVYDAGVEAYRAKRFEVARALWRRAADLHDHAAESNLGFLLYYGHGGPPDSALAAEYWRRAMQGRAAEAHRHVAQAILDGDLRFGQSIDAVSHAVAANAIARRDGQFAGEVVAREATQLLDRLRAGLPRSKVEAATQLGVRWALPNGYP